MQFCIFFVLIFDKKMEILTSFYNPDCWIYHQDRTS